MFRLHVVLLPTRKRPLVRLALRTVALLATPREMPRSVAVVWLETVSRSDTSATAAHTASELKLLHWQSPELQTGCSGGTSPSTAL